MGTFADAAGDLAGQVRGPVLLPDTEGFDEEVACWNTAVVHRPAIAIGALDAEDVAVAVRWAARLGLRVTVHATGHGPAAPVEDGMVISTRRLTDVMIDPSAAVARIGAGVKWAQVIAAAAEHGLAPLNGSSSDVGAVGYTLGGGLGLTARRYGFAADHVRSLRVVTADGQIRTVDEDQDSELFWALRGAGKGRFGVVTEMEIELVPVRNLFGGGIYYPASAAAAVLHAFGPWAKTLPEQTSTSVAMLRLPDAPDVPAPIRGQFVVHLRLAHLGTASEGERIIAPMRAIAPSIVDTLAEMPYTAVDAIHNDPVHPMPAYTAGALLRALPAEAVDALLAAAGPTVEVPLAVVELRLMGGAAGRPAATPNAVSGRDGAFSLFTIAPMIPGLEAVVPAVVTTVLDALEPFTAPTALANFERPSAHSTDEYADWPALDRARLQLIQKTYDPTNLFTGRR